MVGHLLENFGKIIGERYKQGLIALISHSRFDRGWANFLVGNMRGQDGRDHLAPSLPHLIYWMQR
jgi:hypothetical protein